MFAYAEVNSPVLQRSKGCKNQNQPARLPRMKERMLRSAWSDKGQLMGIHGQFLFSSRDNLDSTETQPVLQTSLCLVCRTVSHELASKRLFSWSPKYLKFLCVINARTWWVWGFCLFCCGSGLGFFVWFGSFCSFVFAQVCFICFLVL